MTQEMLVGTSLEGIPTVSVSAITGAGIETLKETIVEAGSTRDGNRGK